MARALQRVGPALLASGGTVVLAMLVLLLARVGSIHTLGPVAAIGVACALLASLTLLPALLTIAGRRGFWPSRRSVTGDPGRPEVPNVWRRFGTRVLRRPGLALGVTAGLFVAMSLGILAFREDYSATGFFKKQTESVDGFKALGEKVPAGRLAPTSVLVEPPAAAGAAARRLRGIGGVASVEPSGRSRDGRIARLSVVFSGDPFDDAGLKRVRTMRDRLEGVGTRVLVGDGSAVQRDFNQAGARDLRVIVPAALIVIAIILGLLLEAVLAPVLLILTVLLSFFGTFGLSVLFIRHVVGDAGLDVSLPTFAFIFLVTLGTDYTIFLASRVREEARRHGTREGVLRALAATGGVITSAGLILAGTFSVLMTLPVTFAFNIGFMVAVGILLDTFIVRTIMVPAIFELVGDRIWWPSTARGESHAFHDRLDDPVRIPADSGHAPRAPGRRPAA
jgi:putative drug exporter of the RND superfamily